MEICRLILSQKRFTTLNYVQPNEQTIFLHVCGSYFDGLQIANEYGENYDEIKRLVIYSDAYIKQLFYSNEDCMSIMEMSDQAIFTLG